jgi:RNA-directed DNA polymerase
VAYCRYADDFTVQVKGTKAHALEVREACRAFLEGKLKLTLNMAKTHITHVNDGFVFLGHRIIRKRGPRGSMRPVTTIPWAKYRGLARKLVNELSGNSVNKIDMVERLNRILAGWANFYQFTDYTAMVFHGPDRGSSGTGSRASIAPPSKPFAVIGYALQRPDWPRPSWWS